ncbi:hypothetical protein MKX01_033400, partial [Papaver californicum]
IKSEIEGRPNPTKGKRSCSIVVLQPTMSELFHQRMDHLQVRVEAVKGAKAEAILQLNLLE